MADFEDQLRKDLAFRYQLEKQIGRGGFALVYAARDLRLKCNVALKALRPEFAAAIWAERFLDEVEITANLNHPHILPVLDRGEAAGTPYYTMPFVEGESLQRRLNREHQMGIEDVIHIAGDVAEALDFAAKRNVVHRDIKPDNILLDESGARVADFGIALAFNLADRQQSTSQALRIGTPPYMSPEQCAGQAGLDGRSDVYSLACVVYEMLKGTTPFSGVSAESICARHMTETPPPLRTVRPTIPKRLERVVLRGLEKAPADRYGTAGEFVATLRRAAQPRRPGAVTQAALAIGLVAVTAWTIIGLVDRGPRIGGAAMVDRTAIAVRPFTDNTPTGGEAVLGADLANRLIDALTEVPVLSVRPLSDVADVIEAGVSPESVATALHVGTVIDGRFAVRNGHLEVAAYLIDTKTNAASPPIVSTAPLDTDGRVPEPIIVNIVSRVRHDLGREIQLDRWRREISDSVAYRAIRNAQALRDTASSFRRQGRTRAAVELLEQADAWLGRAESIDGTSSIPPVLRGWLKADHVRLIEEGEPAKDADTAAVLSWIDAGIAHADRALHMEPADPEALELRGLLNLQKTKWSSTESPDELLRQAQDDLENAVAGNPSLPRAWRSLRIIYQNQGSFSAAAHATTMAQRSDAWLEDVEAAFDDALYDALSQDDPDLASDLCEFGKQYYGSDPTFVQCDLTIVGWTGTRRSDVRRAWQLAEEIERHQQVGRLAADWQLRRILIAAVAARSGLTDSAAAIVEAARPGWGQYGPAPAWDHYEAWIAFLSGDTTSALDLLERYLDNNPWARQFVREEPWFRELREHARFIAITTQPSPP